MYTYVIIAEKNAKRFAITIRGEWFTELASQIKELMVFKKDFACSEKEKHIKMILAINEFQVEYNFPEILEAFLICSLRGIEKICYNLLKNNPQSGEISGDICSLRKAD